MTYVAAAYLLTLAVLAAYVWTLWARQRMLRRMRQVADQPPGGSRPE